MIPPLDRRALLRLAALLACTGPLALPTLDERQKKLYEFFEHPERGEPGR